jgi:hypothetical protein
MATPPAIGEVLEVKRWNAGSDWFVVERTYVNRTVEAAAKSGEHAFLARNDYTGDWHVICGQRLRACRAGVASVTGVRPSTRQVCACARTSRGPDRASHQVGHFADADQVSGPIGLLDWFRGRQRQNSVSCSARALPWL